MTLPTSPVRFQTTDTHIPHTVSQVPDPFAPRQSVGATLVHAILATALFRCWHILVFFTAWSTLISVLNHQGHSLHFQPTLLTLIGTVLGFVISYRTTSSFERYNEGRKLWSQVILASRTFARTVWLHVPDQGPTSTAPEDEMISRSMVEKKTAINLLEAFAVSVKHYLRDEDGIYYQDLYHLVKFLPAYALPAGKPPNADLALPDDSMLMDQPSGSLDSSPGSPERSFFHHKRTSSSSAPQFLPEPVTTSGRYSSKERTFLDPGLNPHSQTNGYTHGMVHNRLREKEQIILSPADEKFLFPAYMPPKSHFFDLFPFSLFVGTLTARGKDIKGKKAAKIRGQMRKNAISHNLPLEISLYLSSYVAALQKRARLDVPTANVLLGSLNQLVDSLTGFERILTTPIPFSYSVHLWVITVIYCLTLPLQIWSALKWVTIPSTVVLSFIFFGFLVAGEEIQDPFGYDNNDLNLDHFTHNIIRNELRAITSTPPPDPAHWAFVPENDLLFATTVNDERTIPSEWMGRGHMEMRKMLNMF